MLKYLLSTHCIDWLHCIDFRSMISFDVWKSRKKTLFTSWCVLFQCFPTCLYIPWLTRSCPVSIHWPVATSSRVLYCVGKAILSAAHIVWPSQIHPICVSCQWVGHIWRAYHSDSVICSLGKRLGCHHPFVFPANVAHCPRDGLVLVQHLRDWVNF